MAGRITSGLQRLLAGADFVKTVTTVTTGPLRSFYCNGCSDLRGDT
jgi:hypothetical protein